MIYLRMQVIPHAGYGFEQAAVYPPVFCAGGRDKYANSGLTRDTPVPKPGRSTHHG